jgi:hypothetical protein
LVKGGYFMVFSIINASNLQMGIGIGINSLERGSVK